MSSAKAILKFLGIAALALAVNSSGVLAETKPPEPQFKAFTLGKMELAVLHDAQFVPANDGKTFGVGQTPAEVGEVLKAAGAPTDVITLSVDALLIKSNKRVVLIDTGIGGALQESLKLAGYTPDAITDILITHAHPDHVGGLVKDGKLAFPNAKIRMSRAEWRSMKDDAKLAEMVKVISDQVKPFKAGARVLPGIMSVAMTGHTPGHVGYQIRSGKEKLFDIGDTAHSSIVSLAKPQWDIAFDGDHSKADENRMKTLTELAKSGELVFAPHFPFPGVGHIKAEGDHFKWEPTLSAQ